MVSLTRKYLLHDRTRLAISLFGVSLAILLIFTLSGIYLGFYRQATIFIDNSGADLWIVQKGAPNFYFAVSFLPSSLQDPIAQVEGVQTVSPFLYQGATLTKDQKSQFVFYFGYDTATGLGGPWNIIEGSQITGQNQIILDTSTASKIGIGVGGSVSLDGHSLVVAGISSGTRGILAPLAFVGLSDAQRISGWTGFVNFFLVKTLPGTSPNSVSSSLRTRLLTVDVFLNSEWSATSRDAIISGITPIFQAMVMMGGLTGFLVIALTNYSGTVERQREYGILKALGMRNRRLFKVVFTQSIIIAVSSFTIGGILSAFVVVALTYIVQSPLTIVYDSNSVASILAAAVLIGGGGALLPARRISRVDPAIAFK